MPFDGVEAFAAEVGAEFEGVLAVRPAHVVGPLKAIFDVQIGIAAAPAGEFRGAGKLSGVIERDVGKAEERARETARGYVFCAKCRAVLSGA